MPFHNGYLPREGFKADTVLSLIRSTALNPKLLLPLILLARYTKKGQDLSILHPTAYKRIKILCWLGVARLLNNYFSNGVLNNWVKDRYNWTREIVVITGGAGGIGGQVVQLLAEKGVTVVVLDIQPLTYDAGQFSFPSSNHHRNSLMMREREKKKKQAQGYTTSNATSPLPRPYQRWPRRSDAK